MSINVPVVLRRRIQRLANAYGGLDAIETDPPDPAVNVLNQLREEHGNAVVDAAFDEARSLGSLIPQEQQQTQFGTGEREAEQRESERARSKLTQEQKTVEREPGQMDIETAAGTRRFDQYEESEGRDTGNG